MNIEGVILRYDGDGRVAVGDLGPVAHIASIVSAMEGVTPIALTCSCLVGLIHSNRDHGLEKHIMALHSCYRRRDSSVMPVGNEVGDVA